MPRSAPHYVDDSCSIRRYWNSDYCSTHYAQVHTCPECGRQFHSQRGDATTCSDRCRKRRARGSSSTSVTTVVTPNRAGESVTGAAPLADSTTITNDDGAAVAVTIHSFATRLTSEQIGTIAAVLADNPTGDVLIRFIRPRRQE